MDISATVSQLASKNPQVGVAVAAANVKGAVLAGLLTGESDTATLLGDLANQQIEEAQLLQSVLPVPSGQNIDLRA